MEYVHNSHLQQDVQLVDVVAECLGGHLVPGVGGPAAVHRHNTTLSYVTSCVILSAATGWAGAVLYCTPQYSTVLHSTAQLGLS